ncbi:MAG: hypothetical protein FJZ96_10965, partial [Chloroflexi bacterium]|nr:hypothetical protein [Chloroflexota bacterium]
MGAVTPRTRTSGWTCISSTPSTWRGSSANSRNPPFSKEKPMKKSFRFALLTTTIILLVSACAPGGSSISLGTGEEILLVGFTTSMTGKYAREGTDQANGLNLWISHVNEAGGIQLPDGRAAFIEARFYDDQSDKERVPQLYIDLIEQDRVQFLFSPYGSSLTTAAAAVAQEHGVLMVTAGAAAEATHQPGYTVIYQTYTPASRYLTGAFDLYAAQPPQDRRVALVYENDTFAILAIDAIRQAAIELGLAIVVDEMYEAGQTDFSALMDTLAARHPAAIFGGGHSVDSTALARAIHEHGVPFEYIALLVGPAEPSFGDIGLAARGVIGPSQWEPQASFTRQDAYRLGLEYTGPTGTEFIEAYRAAYGEEPSYFA